MKKKKNMFAWFSTVFSASGTVTVQSGYLVNICSRNEWMSTIHQIESYVHSVKKMSICPQGVNNLVVGERSKVAIP